MAKRSVSADINRPVSVTVTGGGVAATGGGGGGTLPGTITPTTGNTVTGGRHTHRMLPTHAALPDIGPDDHHAPVTVGNTGLSIAGQQVSLNLAAVSGLEVDGGLKLADSIAGDGLSIASKVLGIDLATNSGLQLSGSPARLHLRTPSSVSVSSANTVTDALGHTHAVTASSNPGAASVLLKSNASGYLQLTRIGLGTAPDYPLHVIGAGRIDGDLTFVGAQSILTTADSLTLAPAADLDLSPGGTARVRATSGVRLQSDNYVSQMTGWGIGYNGGADFRYLYADELHAKSFITDLEQALAGGQIIAKSVAVVAVAFTAPASGGVTYLYVEDLPGAAGMAVFQSGDTVRLRKFSRGSGSLTITDCWGTVTAYLDQGDGIQRWTFTRFAWPYGGTLDAGQIVPAKSLALDYGVSGNGFYEVNAIDGAWAENSPYAQIVTWTGYAQSGQVVRSRWGNLKGIFNVANEYGLYAGDGVTDASKFLRISSQTVEAHNLPIRMYDGASATIALDPAAPSFAMGATLPSAYGTGSGLWMGKDGGTYKFRVGTESGSMFIWNGTDVYVRADLGNYLRTNGTNIEFYSAYMKVIDITNAPSVTIGRVAPGQGNVQISAGAIALRVNTTETIKLCSTGAAVFGQVATGKGNIYWNPSNGRLEFRGSTNGTVVQAYVDTDGAIAAGGGSHILDQNGFTIREAGDTYLYRYYDMNDHLVSDDYVLIDESTPPAKYIYRDIIVNDDYYTAGGFRFMVNRGGAPRVKLELKTFSPSRLTLNADVFSINGGALNVGMTGIYGSAGDIYASGGLNVGTATGAGAGEIFTSGDVGIGTSSPQSRLNVMVAGTNIVPVYIESSSYFQYAGGKIALEFRTLDTRGTAARNARIGMTNLQPWTQSPALYFEAGNTEIMRLLSAGRVLIGTASDDGVNRLQVNGSVKAVYTTTSWLDILDGVAAPATVSGWARIYVDSADGDLKIKFGNGTVKTIVTD